MLIDIHNHLGYSSDGGEAPLEAILSNIEIYNINKLVIFAIDEEDSGETYENSNRRILEACKLHPDKLIPFARLMPSAGQKAVDEFKFCIDSGVRGLKLKTKDGFEPEDSTSVLDIIGDNPMFPVLIHVEHEPMAQPKLWEPVVKDYPNISFILAHGGKDHYRICAELAVKYANVYLDTSTLSYNRTKWIYKEIGASKILFGSDFPYSHPAIELQKFNLILSNEEDKNAIFSANALKILKV